jgi:crotonobetainyl-CoA:carnitine CoA-transferase CaiB-like acyl-CoA transferase
MQPFEGVKVLDFTWLGVGPLAVNYLAFYGATAIKVESSIRPDPLRHLTPYKDGIRGLERSYYWAHAHPAKRLDITLNLNHPKAIEIARRLVAWADVVAESFLPGTMEKWGLGYEDLKKIKPEIIMLRTCMHGQTGPLAKHPGLGLVLTALSGFVAINGWPDRPPSALYGAFTDFMAPLFNAIALIGALNHRRQTGKGQCLDVSQHEACMHCIGPLFLDSAVNQREPTRNGNRIAYAAPHGIYRCQGDDRWCAITVFTDEEWKNFCRVIGSPAWVNDPKFNTLPGRKQNEDELDKRVEAWTSQHTAEKVMGLMQAEGVGAGLVANARDLAEDPQLKHYQCYQELDHPEMGRMSFYLPPGFTLSKASYERVHPPLLGEYNEYVYVQLLGIPDKEFVQLMEEGVFD